MTDLLHASNVSKRYGNTFALQDAHFSLRTGEVHALMGENGAGKSTFAGILAGVTSPTTARITIDGEATQIQSLMDAQRLGIGIIYQELDLFLHQTVGENIVMKNPRFKEGLIVRMAEIRSFCVPYLEQVGLSQDFVTRKVASLSIGEMQLVAIARSLSLEARILIMDEPTSSLMNDSVERLFALIARLKSQGVAIVYVSHKMEEIFRICNRITVLRDGKTVGTREIAETNIQEVIAMMVGREIAQQTKPTRRKSDHVLLSVHELSTAKLKDVSFELFRGEVLGIAGLVGSGRSELGAALFGLDKISSGAMQRNGKDYSPRSAADAIRNGFGLVPEDRKLEGLMMQMSILENGTMAIIPRMETAGFIHRKEEASELGKMRETLALKCASLDAPVSSLSGGNQQKTLLARWLMLNPEIIFLDDPTRGIDVSAKQDVYRMIDQLAASGKGVLLVSSELPELLRCSDRILVMNNGALATTLEGSTTQESIMSAATAVFPRVM
jgi:ribose transport system ATP-binding protein